MTTGTRTADTVRQYFPGLNTLRGIAVILVVLYHNFNFLPLTQFGFLGVDLFFVLSGFLITDILLRTKARPHYFTNFYTRRVLRIFPVYFASLLFLFFILPSFLKVNYDLNYYRNNQYWFYLFIQNWLFVIKPLEKSFLLNHFWSIAIEEQFYIVWPFVIYSIKKTQTLLRLLCILFLSLFVFRWWILFEHMQDQRIFSFLRFDGLLAGSAIALIKWHKLQMPRHLNAILIVLLAALNAGFLAIIMVFKKNLPYFPCCGFTTFTILFGMATHYAVYLKKLPAMLPLTEKVLHFFGKISYGLYIYHWPIFVLLSPVFRQFFEQQFHLAYLTAYYCSPVLATALAIALSAVSYRYYETIFLRLKNRFSL